MIGPVETVWFDLLCDQCGLSGPLTLVLPEGVTIDDIKTGHLPLRWTCKCGAKHETSHVVPSYG